MGFDPTPSEFHTRNITTELRKCGSAKIYKFFENFFPTPNEVRVCGHSGSGSQCECRKGETYERTHRHTHTPTPILGIRDKSAPCRYAALRRFCPFPYGERTRILQCIVTIFAAFDNSSDWQSEQSDSNKKDCQPSGFSNQHIYLFIRAKLGIFLVQIEKENNERHDSHVGSMTWQLYWFIQCHKETLWNVGRNVCLIDMEQYFLPCLFCRRLYVPNVPSMVYK